MTTLKKVLVVVGIVIVGFVISLIIDNGIPLFLALLIAVVLIVVFIVSRAKKTMAGKSLVGVLKTESNVSNERNKPARYKYQVAGLFYRMDALLSVAQRHKDFGLSDEEFIAKHSNGRAVYEYRLKRSSVVSLVPEPTNPHDPNAIAVYVDDKHVGYISASETSEVKRLMIGDYAVHGWLAGGASKTVKDGRVVTDASDINMYVEIEPPVRV